VIDCTLVRKITRILSAAELSVQEQMAAISVTAIRNQRHGSPGYDGENSLCRKVWYQQRRFKNNLIQISRTLYPGQQYLGPEDSENKSPPNKLLVG